MPEGGTEPIIIPEEVYATDAPFKPLVLQSGLIQKSSSDGTTNDTEGVVSFDDNVSGEAMDLPQTLESDKPVVSENANLNKFLSRPVEIYNYSWSLGGTSNVAIYPWYEFMNHPSIKRKLDNYYLFKGNLKVKFVINASPFYYGALMVSYVPLLQFVNPVISPLGKPDISYSQLPRVYLYPSASQGATMLIPFVYHKKWLDIVSANEVQNMGSLVFRVLDSLKTASSSTSSINIKVYAWMEDAILSAPTVSLALQSGKIDEYGEGRVSKPASAISRAMGQLSNIPIIGPFATATSMAAGTVSSIASLFGYTNVPVISDVHSYVPEPFPSLASTDIGTPLTKLTLDSKNELSIDPKICGCDFGDEMLISNLVSRESYLDKFTWSASTSSDSLLYNIGISPTMVGVTPATSQSILNGTPMWLVSRLFEYWRGDIEVRFKVICSQYHRGRLRFSWDPRGNISTTTDSTTEVYTKIVDIAESTDITIRIPYMQVTEYRQVNANIEERFSTSPLSQSGFENGILTVRVLTELTSPVTTADVSVLVFIRGCDNLEFSCPRTIDVYSTISPFTIQSGDLLYDNEDEDISSIALKPSTVDPNINLIYNGESIKSLRTLIRRSSFLRTAFITGGTGSSLIYQIRGGEFARLPMFPGFDGSGINSAIGPISGVAKPYNFCNYTPLTWLAQCFLANRGSVHWHVNPLNPALNSELRLARPGNNLAITTSSYSSNYGGAVTNNEAARLSVWNSLTMIAGGVMTNNRTKSGVSASFPFYSNFKFRSHSPSYAVTGVSFDGSNVDKCIFVEMLTPKTSIADNPEWNNGCGYNFYVGAGTDFTFVFFLAVPTLYKYNAYPVAA